jgi:DNA-binding NarL/FixJ family response regulator
LLTLEEMQVLALIVQGFTVSDISKLYVIDEDVISSVIASAQLKLGTTEIESAAWSSQMNGYIDPEVCSYAGIMRPFKFDVRSGVRRTVL